MTILTRALPALLAGLLAGCHATAPTSIEVAQPPTVAKATAPTAATVSPHRQIMMYTGSAPTGFGTAGYPAAGYPAATFQSANYAAATYATAGYPAAGYPAAGYPGGYAPWLIQTYPQMEGQTVQSVAYGYDGQTVYLDGNGRVHIFNPYTGQDFIAPLAGNTHTGPGVTPPFLPGGVVAEMGTSPDGRLLLYSQGGLLRLVDLTSGFTDNLPLLNDGNPVLDAHFVDATGRLIAFTRGTRILVFDRATNLIDTMPIANQAFAAYGAGAGGHGYGLGWR